MRVKMDADNAVLADHLSQETALKGFLAMVSQICYDNCNIADSIEGAISASTKLKWGFTEQEIEFKNLASQWDNIYKSAKDSGDADEAALDMQPSVESAQALWAEVSTFCL